MTRNASTTEEPDAGKPQISTFAGRFTKAQTEKTMPKLVISPSLSIDTGNTIALQADSGLYLSRIARGPDNPIEAEKDSIDAFS